MDLYGAITALAALNGVKRDKRDPFKHMPKKVQKINLLHEGKQVNIPKTVEKFFNNPSFICEDVEKFWQHVINDPQEYIIDVAEEFRTEIVYT